MAEAERPERPERLRPDRAARPERPARRGRSRDRREQLAAVAADLFRRHGYHNVGVGDIAAAAGITGPAVYRHFRSKQEILGHVVLACADQLSTAVHTALDSAEVHAAEVHPAEVHPAERNGATSAAGRLDVLLRALAQLSVERRELGALWRREGRSLPPADRAELAARLAQATKFGAEMIKQARPRLPEQDAALLCSAAMSVFASASDHHVTLPKARFERLLHSMALAVVRSDLPGAPAGQPAVPVLEAAVLSDRREQLLAVAAKMFCERGFHDVTMEDIGAAAGIAGPSIYRHYASKADLLAAMCSRVGERLRAGLAAALGEARGGPQAVFASLAGSFVHTELANRDLVAAFLTEGRNLPDRYQAEVRRVLRAYVSEWVRVVLAAASGQDEPGQDDKAARIRVHAAFAVVNDLARIAAFAARPSLAADLTVLVGAVAGVAEGRDPAQDVDLLGAPVERGELDQ